MKDWQKYVVELVETVTREVAIDQLDDYTNQALQICSKKFNISIDEVRHFFFEKWMSRPDYFHF